MKQRYALVMVVVTAAFGLGLVAPTAAPASCIGPSIEVTGAPVVTSSGEPTTDGMGRPLQTVRLAPGDPLSVRGEWFFVGCNDTAVATACSGPPEHTPEAPARNVRLVLTQGGRSWLLGTADAAGPARHYAVSWSAQLPADLEPGPATLRARTAKAPVDVIAG